MKPKHKQMKKKITPKHYQVAQHQKNYVGKEHEQSSQRVLFREDNSGAETVG